MDNNNINNVYYAMQRVKQAMPKLPRVVGNEVVNFALDNFKRQAWLGETIQPWPRRKNPTKWGKKIKRPGRNILIDSGRLRRSIRVVRADWGSIIVGSDVPYARVHNEGFRGIVEQTVQSHERRINGIATVQSIKTRRKRRVKVQTGVTQVREHSRRINQRIPRRRYLGDSPYLRQRIQRIVTAEIMRAFK